MSASPGSRPQLRIAIIGTGFGGLAMAVALLRAGISSFVILDKDSQAGGTWAANTYPGCECDVPSHLYSYSFAPNPRWSHVFSPQGEILDYTRDIIRRFGLEAHIRLNSQVTGARFDEARAVWTLSVAGQPDLEVDVVVGATGGLSRPVSPDFAGLESFEGTVFHSARWRHDVALDGLRVGLVGTGASAIQIGPAIASTVGALTVFQRTAPWILPRDSSEYSPLAKAAFARVPALGWLHRQQIYWTLEARATAFLHEPRLLQLAEGIAHRHIRRGVRDPALRQKVTPTYRMGCKRILMSNTWYPMLERPNVSLQTEGIERVEPRGIRTRDGRLHELDAIVMATGFQAADAAAPFPVAGRGGAQLETLWATDAMAYKGTTVGSFPNLFLIVGPNTGLGHSSMIFMIESQVAYVLSAIETMRRDDLASVEVRPEAVEAWNVDIQRKLGRTVWESGCAAWYRSSSGRNTTLWPGFTWQFRLATRKFDSDRYVVRRRAEVFAPGES